MASVNKVILVGKLGRDPEMRALPSGDQIANLRIATNDKWRDKQSGEMREATEWHTVVFFGRQAEVCGQYLRKGSQVYVEGSLRTRKWQDKDTGTDRYATEIRGDTMQMLGSRQGTGGDTSYGGDHGGDSGFGAPAPRPAPARAPAPVPRAPAPPPRPAAGSGMEDMEDDIPF